MLNMYQAYTKRRFSKGKKEGEIIETGWLPPLPDMRDYQKKKWLNYIHIQK